MTIEERLKEINDLKPVYVTSRREHHSYVITKSPSLKEQLENIEKLELEATDGEWWYDGINYIFAKHETIGDAMVAEVRGQGSNFPMDINGHLIAAHHNAFGLLRNEVKRLEKENELLKAVLEPFATSAVAETVEREDYGYMKERIKSWFNDSDFKDARKVFTELTDKEE